MRLCVDFILNDRNIQRISRGTKHVDIEGKEVYFPKLVRKKLTENMMRDYIYVYPERTDRIGDRYFLKFVNSITNIDMKDKLAVD